MFAQSTMLSAGVLHIKCIDAYHDVLTKRGNVAAPIIHDLHIRPNVDNKPIYDAIHIYSTAAKNAIYVDGFDVREPKNENDRLRSEVQLLLHVGKEAE